jgi:O-acetyl-ADP-ribose deacetylase (regulator of RNase III)
MTVTSQGASSLVRGDITQQDTDAIVNAANTTLLGGGGVDGAIHRAGGPDILAECKQLGGCATGDAKITTGGRLRARRVIHTVGPVYRAGGQREADLLASAYRRSLEVASQHGLRSIAFPSISTGAYRYPIGDAARIALTTVATYLQRPPRNRPGPLRPLQRIGPGGCTRSTEVSVTSVALCGELQAPSISNPISVTIVCASR